VVLLHGTFGLTNWSAVQYALSAKGFSVYPFEYGRDGTAEIGQSAAALARFVDQLTARTGVERVSIIGHSQGGVMARYYVKFLGGSAHVDDLIGLSPPNHGTASPVVQVVGSFSCDACVEQQAGSPFLTNLNSGEETLPPVDYTVVQTRDDLVVVPYTSAFLDGPPDRVTNITLQQRCPGHFVDHVNIPSDPVAIQWIEDALAHRGPADPAFAPSC
jgi:triacylglycerol lipase